MSKKPVYPAVLWSKTIMSTRSSLTQSLLGLLICCLKGILWVHPYHSTSTGQVGPRLGNSGSLMEWKRCHYLMVEVAIQIKLLPPSILDIYKVFMHIDMLSVGIQ